MWLERLSGIFSAFVSAVGVREGGGGGEGKIELSRALYLLEKLFL